MIVAPLLRRQISLASASYIRRIIVSEARLSTRRRGGEMGKDRTGDLDATQVMQIPAVSDLPIRLTRMAPREAAKILMRVPDAEAARALSLINPSLTVDILSFFPAERRGPHRGRRDLGSRRAVVGRRELRSPYRRPPDGQAAGRVRAGHHRERGDRTAARPGQAGKASPRLRHRGRRQATGRLRLPRAAVRAARRAGLIAHEQGSGDAAAPT